MALHISRTLENATHDVHWTDRCGGNSIVGYHCLTALELKSEQITLHECVKKAGNSTDDGVTRAHPETTHNNCHDLDYDP